MKTKTHSSSRSGKRKLGPHKVEAPKTATERGVPENDLVADKFAHVEDGMGFQVMQFSGDSDTRTRKVKMLRAMTASLGNVTQASVDAGVLRETHYYWVRNDPVYAKGVELIDEVSLDFAEQALKKNIRSGNVIAQIFYLKTKGKKRGYVEQVKHVMGNAEEGIFAGVGTGSDLSAMKGELPPSAVSESLKMLSEG
jgi:hypothetical protein